MVEMNRARKRLYRNQSLLSDRLVLAFFFAAGAAVAFFGASILPSILRPRLFWSLLMGAVLLFSVSMAGAVLLPFSALLCGVFAEQSAMTWAEAMERGLPRGFRDPICAFVLVSFFFLAAVHGMAVSTSIQTAALRGSPTAREAYRQEIPLVFLFGVAALAAAFYFF